MRSRLALAIAALALATALAAAPAPAASGTLVSYTRQGGIAALRESLVVTRAGRATSSGPRGRDVRTLRPATMRHLRSLLASARFDRLPKPEGACPDCLHYAITYAGRRVSFSDSRRMPASVRAALAELQRLAGGGR